MFWEHAEPINNSLYGHKMLPFHIFWMIYCATYTENTSVSFLHTRKIQFRKSNHLHQKLQSKEKYLTRYRIRASSIAYMYEMIKGGLYLLPLLRMLHTLIFGQDVPNSNRRENRDFIYKLFHI